MSEFSIRNSIFDPLGRPASKPSAIPSERSADPRGLRVQGSDLRRGPGSGVEGVAEGIADEVEGQQRGDQRQAGKGGQPPAAYASVDGLGAVGRCYRLHG